MGLYRLPRTTEPLHVCTEMNVPNLPEGQGSKVTNVSPWYGVYYPWASRLPSLRSSQVCLFVAGGSLLKRGLRYPSLRVGLVRLHSRAWVEMNRISLRPVMIQFSPRSVSCLS